MVSRSPKYANGTMDKLVRENKIKLHFFWFSLRENKKIDIKYSLVVYLT